MAVNKVTYGGETLIDLTSDTVTANDLAAGVTATAADGTKVTGLLPKVEIDTALSSTSTNPVQNKVINTALNAKQAAGSYVTYTANANITAGKKTGVTTYTYGQSPMVVANGLIIGGTAKDAGLVTRGICGVGVPDNTGACTTSELYINYDGDSAYSRSMVLGAGSTGNAITASTASSTVATNSYGTLFSAVRGDQMVNFVNAKLANYKVTVDSALSSTSTNPVQNKVINTALSAKANTSDLATVATSGSYSDLTNKPTILSALTATDDGDGNVTLVLS